MNSILLLSVAVRSVVKTLGNENGFNGKTVGVEIAHEIIEIANKYFKRNEIKKIQKK